MIFHVSARYQGPVSALTDAVIPLGYSFAFPRVRLLGLMEIVNCPERERLIGEVTDALRQIIQIALRQRTALKMNSYAAYLLDQEFADAVGEKERRLGALIEHERGHGCG